MMNKKNRSLTWLCLNLNVFLISFKYTPSVRGICFKMGEGCLQYSSNALTYKAVKTVNMNCFLQQDFLSFGLSRLRVLLLLSTSFDKFLLRQLSCSKFRFSLQYLPRDKETESLLLLVMITIYLFFNHTTHTTLRITYTKAKLSKKVSACAPSSPPDLEILHHEPK